MTVVGAAMGDELAAPPQAEHAADLLAAVLEAVVMPVAESRDRMMSTAATPEEVDTITALRQLAQVLPDFCRRAILGEIGSDHWARMSHLLQQAARTCRQHVVIEIHDVGDAGGR